MAEIGKPLREHIIREAPIPTVPKPEPVTLPTQVPVPAHAIVKQMATGTLYFSNGLVVHNLEFVSAESLIPDDEDDWIEETDTDNDKKAYEEEEDWNEEDEDYWDEEEFDEDENEQEDLKSLRIVSPRWRDDD